MKCPHCLTDFHDDWDSDFIGKDKNGSWGSHYTECPTCHNIIIFIINGQWDVNQHKFIIMKNRFMVYPKGISRNPCPISVPENFSADYKEACLVLSDSPKSSAALGRRCLQNLLRECAKVKHSNLFDEIQEVINNKSLPTYLIESIDAIRNIGNLAAHPIKSKTTGEIVDVEPHEAEWTLDVIESLFDFYFVQPEIIKAKKDDLNKKLADAGKPIMK